MRTNCLPPLPPLGLVWPRRSAADNASGYVYSDFWGTEPAQQAPPGKAPVQANGPTPVWAAWANVIEARGSGGPAFVDYRHEIIPW
jgi:hypothetical protein